MLLTHCESFVRLPDSTFGGFPRSPSHVTAMAAQMRLKEVLPPFLSLLGVLQSMTLWDCCQVVALSPRLQARSICRQETAMSLEVHMQLSNHAF